MGSLFPPPIVNFIYAFNVPLFFIISGFLSKREESLAVCWNKCLVNLFVPYLILSFLHCIEFLLRHLSDGMWLWSVTAVMTGFHNLHDAPGCSNLWFVYTLIVIKLLFCAFGKTNKGVAGLVVMSVIGAIAYNASDCRMSWAVTDAFVAMPFFVTGNLLTYNLKNGYARLIDSICRLGAVSKALLTIMLITLTFVIAECNGFAKMFKGEYGNNFLLFLLAAVTGTMFVFVVSLWLRRYDLKAVRIISLGSLVILTYHKEFNHPMLKLIHNADMDAMSETVATFFGSIISLLAFIPIVMILQKIFPMVLGMSRAKKFK